MSSAPLSMTSITKNTSPEVNTNVSLQQFVEQFKTKLPADVQLIAELLPTEIPKEEGISTDYSEEQIFKSEIEQLNYYTDNVLEAQARIELAYLKLILFPNTARLLEPLATLSDILFSGEVNPITSKEQFDQINSYLTTINDTINDVLNKNAQGVDVKDIDPETESIKNAVVQTNGLFDVYKANQNVKFILRRDARALVSSLPSDTITANPFKGTSILSSSITPVTETPTVAPVTGTPTVAPVTVKGGKSRRRRVQRASRNYKRTQKRTRL
jgi:hypothetical protein